MPVERRKRERSDTFRQHTGEMKQAATEAEQSRQRGGGEEINGH